MRLNNRKKTDYAAISRRSIKKDFYSEQIHMGKKTGPEKRNSNEIRIFKINPACQYAKFSRFFVGKLVRLADKTGTGESTTGWYEFIHDEDRKALNSAAGWSDNKRQYLLENPKIK